MLIARKSPAWLAFALLAAANAHAQSVVQIVPAPSWRLAGSERIAVEQVRRWGGDPAVEREYGVHGLLLQTFRLGAANAEVIVEQAADPVAAYGLFTFYQTETMKPVAGMSFALRGADGAIMARSRLFLRIPLPAKPPLSNEELRALLVTLGASSPLPEDMKILPFPVAAPGLVRGSEKYLLGTQAANRVLPGFPSDLFGFSQGAEVAVADYSVDRSRLRLLTVTYPTPQIARARFDSLSERLSINKTRGSGSVFGKRTGSFALIVLGSDGSGPAERLLNEFRYTQQVSSNEPYPGKPLVLQVVGLVIANLMFVFILVGFVPLGGVIFFLLRRLAMRVFPDADWAQADSATIIRLNLTVP